jgi:predicted lipid-binding transport protein (Tim44 family)
VTVTDETDDALNGEPRPAAQPDPESVTPETASAQAEDEFEGATPPGYDWPTHGGYLGCLMGVMAGVLLGGFLGANIFAAYYNVLDLPLAVYILLNVALFIVLLIGLGRLGWWLGRRYYRYYPQPAGPTWGESDEDSDKDQASEPTSSAEVNSSDSAPESAAHEATATAAEPEASERRPGLTLLGEADKREDNRGDGADETAEQAEDADDNPERAPRGVTR